MARRRSERKRNRPLPRELTPLRVGVGAVAFLCALAILRYGTESPAVQASNAAPVVSAYDMIKVPVPSTLVPAGTKLREVRFRLESFPSSQVPPGALRDITPYLDAVTNAALPAHLPLFEQNLNHAGGIMNPVIEQIPEGMRAMSVRLDATSSVEGWAGSGAIVDVLLVNKDATLVVAEQVRILSVERSVSPVDGAASPSVPSTATLLVTQEQCLAINTAVNQGKIAFALRSLGDSGDWTRSKFQASSLRTGARNSSSTPKIAGYISVHDEQGKTQSYALSDGKWLPADGSINRGFSAGSTASSLPSLRKTEKNSED